MPAPKIRAKITTAGQTKPDTSRLLTALNNAGRELKRESKAVLKENNAINRGGIYKGFRYRVNRRAQRVVGFTFRNTSRHAIFVHEGTGPWQGQGNRYEDFTESPIYKRIRLWAEQKLKLPTESQQKSLKRSRSQFTKIRRNIRSRDPLRRRVARESYKQALPGARRLRFGRRTKFSRQLGRIQAAKGRRAVASERTVRKRAPAIRDELQTYSKDSFYPILRSIREEGTSQYRGRLHPGPALPFMDLAIDRMHRSYIDEIIAAQSYAIVERIVSGLDVEIR